ncbi:hypothetical protein RvY_11511-2 [Ramazzottius varieornatus]|uniref:Uncharacterized protein n=1 Tax=Ramazzottius varieornatus TaxID=947166 RepID=A0A1D1VGF0_RAMVA|nr:hypothetical protein RvY_11511-2 [Ramazzottius varieornatus]
MLSALLYNLSNKGVSWTRQCWSSCQITVELVKEAQFLTSTDQTTVTTGHYVEQWLHRKQCSVICGSMILLHFLLGQIPRRREGSCACREFVTASSRSGLHRTVSRHRLSTDHCSSGGREEQERRARPSTEPVQSCLWALRESGTIRLLVGKTGYLLL